MKDVPIWAARLRAERRKRLWTQREMAKRLADAADEHTHARLPTRESLIRNIKDWEAGNHRPKDPYPVLYSRAFAIVEDQLFGNGGAPPRRAPADILKELLRGENPLAPIANRTGRRVGSETLADLSARVHGLRLADDLIAGKDLIQPAFRELDAAVRIYREGTYHENVGKGLLVAIGEFAQIAGWVASDAGQHDQAARTYRLGISAAHEAGDGTLASNLIGSLAYQTTNTGDPNEGVALAYAALDAAAPHDSPRARALAWDRVAWAHVRAGEAQAAMRALGEADTALTNLGTENEPAYLYWINAGELQIMEARAYTELRRPLRAVPLLTDVLGQYNTTHTRELALYLSWLTVALTDANEPEEAAQAAERMLNLSADVASDRTAQRAKIVRTRLERYRDVPQVRDLLHDHRWDH
ncbi:transcriptional regulator [Sphaerisporangium sp. NPDC049002]|uniref:transcriptional regulator n=1 Tax=unclassified Sphaerisporangium TaxID=2630420 RepID=UPI0033F1BB1B